MNIVEKNSRFEFVDVSGKLRSYSRKRDAVRFIKNNPSVVIPSSKSTDTVLVLRTCKADMSAYEGFIWPKSGMVKCPDWRPIAQCGNGLHGFLWGEGDGSLANWDDSAKWLVVRVKSTDIVKIDNSKVKFPLGEVIYCGNRADAIKLIKSEAPKNVTKIIGDIATAGDRGTATAGYGGTATAGDGGIATAGYGGIATAGDRGTATAGDWGIATAGYGGTATAGDWGTATAGYGGTATAGDWGTATAGDGGTATAGYGGTVIIKWYDYTNNRYRFSVAYPGENIKPNTKYKLDDNHNFVEVK